MKVEKLVRDFVPRIMASSGSNPEFRYVEENEMLPWLILKLREETNELEEVPSIEECADVLEVLLAIGSLHGFSLDEILECASNKKSERGGFEDGCILTLQT